MLDYNDALIAFECPYLFSEEGLDEAEEMAKRVLEICTHKCVDCKHAMQPLNDVLYCGYYAIAKRLDGFCDKWGPKNG